MIFKKVVLITLLLFNAMTFVLAPNVEAQVRRPAKRFFAKQMEYQLIMGQPQRLFNGENLDGWTTVSESKEMKAWEAVDGTLHRKSGGGDIVTEKEYGNFILDFEWKIVKGANSGVKYKFAKMGDQWLGCEYQILDNQNHSDGQLPTHRTGSLYDIIAAPEDTSAMPVGEYNQSRIVVNGNRIQHYLNGKKIVDVVVGSPTWEKGFQTSKFKEHPEFGKIAQGKILLQDHGNEIWFKNIDLRELQMVAVYPKRLNGVQRLRMR